MLTKVLFSRGNEPLYAISPMKKDIQTKQLFSEILYTFTRAVSRYSTSFPVVTSLTIQQARKHLDGVAGSMFCKHMATWHAQHDRDSTCKWSIWKGTAVIFWKIRLVSIVRTQDHPPFISHGVRTFGRGTTLLQVVVSTSGTFVVWGMVVWDSRGAPK